MNKNNDNHSNVPGYVEYLDLNHRYYVVIALSKENEDHIFDCSFFDKKGEIKEGFEGFWFNEKMFNLLEDYLFNFIDEECGLLINMYEEEYIFPELLPKALEITNRMINNCDNEEVLEPAKEIRRLMEKAMQLDTAIGFCF